MLGSNLVIGDFADCPLDVTLGVIELTQCATNIVLAIRVCIIPRST
jgi:hypothetical protein